MLGPNHSRSHLPGLRPKNSLGLGFFLWTTGEGGTHLLGGGGPGGLRGPRDEFRPAGKEEGRGRNGTGDLFPAPPGRPSRTAAGPPPRSDCVSADPVAATVWPLCPVSLTVGSS